VLVYLNEEIDASKNGYIRLNFDDNPTPFVYYLRNRVSILFRLKSCDWDLEEVYADIKLLYYARFETLNSFWEIRNPVPIFGVESGASIETYMINIYRSDIGRFFYKM
jgi:hypothetical protein